MNKKRINRKTRKTRKLNKGRGKNKGSSSRDPIKSTRRSSRSRKAPVKFVPEDIAPKKKESKKEGPRKLQLESGIIKDSTSNFKINQSVIVHKLWKKSYETSINDKFLELLESKTGKVDANDKLLDSYKDLVNIIKDLDNFYGELKLKLKVQNYFIPDLDVKYFKWKKNNVKNYYAYTIFRLLSILLTYNRLNLDNVNRKIKTRMINLFLNLEKRSWLKTLPKIQRDGLKNIIESFIGEGEYSEEDVSLLTDEDLLKADIELRKKRLLETVLEESK